MTIDDIKALIALGESRTLELGRRLRYRHIQKTFLWIERTESEDGKRELRG